MKERGDAAKVPLYLYRFGTAQLDESRLELQLSGLLVEVEQKPLRVLLELLRNVNEPLSRESLLDTVWEGRATVPNVLTNAIAKLRKSLGEEEGARIVTLPNIGYQFNGPVDRVAIGRRLLSRLELNAGETVPGRSHFLLESQIGASTGAEVWLARHLKSREPLVFKFSLDGTHLPALKREATLYRVLRDALGEREDLVRIRDWNFEAEPFYLECEYGGDNLARWADTGNRLQALSPAQRLELFLQVANAVAAAHSVGVLHRDLKPTNILISPKGDSGWQVRVGDFGSGRLLEPGVLEELGISLLGLGPADGLSTDTRSGTPFYLAPEVIAGEPTTVRSDLFALGMLLYQLLQGDLKRPMPPDWAAGVDDPLLREDILAATAGDPLQRLGSVSELAARLRNLELRRAQRNDLQRIKDRALLAERELEAARARRPWLWAAMASLTAGVAISLGSYEAERSMRHRAEAEASRAESINRFLNDDLLGAADPIAPGQHNNATITEVLARASMRLDGRFQDNLLSKGTIELALGRAYFGLADYPAAELHQRRSVGLLSAGAGPADPRTLEAEYVLCRTLMLRARYDEVEALLDAADHDAGRRLAEPSELALLARWTRGGLAFMRNQPQEALRWFQEADRIRLQAAAQDESWLFKVRGNMAWAFNRLHREAEALNALGDLTSPVYGPERVGVLDWAKVQFESGIALVGLGRFGDAVKVAQAALDRTEQALGPEHYMTAIVLNHVAQARQAQGQWPEAIAAAERAYGIIRRSLGERNRATLGTYSNIGALYLLAGQREKGLRVLTEAHVGLSEVLGSADPMTQDNDYYLAYAMAGAERMTEAARLAAALDPKALTSVEPGYDWDGQLAGLRGLLLLGQDRKGEAAAELTAAITHLNRSGAPGWIVPSLRLALDSATRT
jgi:non-specific serine/threonine protein kinase